MVTWGPTTTFNIPGNANSSNTSAPAPSSGFSFGAPAPSPAFGAPAPSGGLFGSKPSTGSLFGGAPAPAPSGGGLFGAPSPAPSGGLFGTASPAPSGGLFGSAPAPSGGLFGAPAASGGLFGAPAAAPVQNQTPAIPAQAALQAHIDASARQEAARLQEKIQQLNASYVGQNDKLCCVVYNPLDENQKRWILANTQGAENQVFIPPRPGQIKEEDWLKAVVNNPDSKTHIPTILIGADGLQSRLGYQQEQANRYEQSLDTLKQTWADMQKRSTRVQQDLKALKQTHILLQRRLLQIMHKVEIARCMNLPLQEQELELTKQLQGVLRQLQQQSSLLKKVSLQLPPPSLRGVEMPDRQALKEVLEGQRQGLVQMSRIVESDTRDLNLIQQQVSRASH